MTPILSHGRPRLCFLPWKGAAQHVVEDEQMIVARALGGLRIVPDHGGIRADLRLRKHYSELHVDALLDRGMAHRSTSLSSEPSPPQPRPVTQRLTRGGGPDYHPTQSAGAMGCWPRCRHGLTPRSRFTPRRTWPGS